MNRKVELTAKSDLELDHLLPWSTRVRDEDGQDDCRLRRKRCHVDADLPCYGDDNKQLDRH